jgi:ABC-type polysaccharide/polyol phosphate export permease
MTPIEIYDSAELPPPLVGEFQELWRYRELLLMLVVSSIKARYKRSFFGLAWTMLNPLLHMAVMAAAFSTVFRWTLPHYPVYVLAGLLCWNFFTQAAAHSMSSLVWGGGLLKRIYVPRTIFVFAAVGNGLVNLALSLVSLLAIMLVFGHPITAACWSVPAALFLLMLFTLGVALFMSVLAVFFGDVVEFYQALVQISFFLTPIMYPKEILPAQYAWLLKLNPMFYLIEIFRAPVYSGVLPQAGVFGIAAASALASFAFGWWAYTRKTDEFAYRL